MNFKEKLELELENCKCHLDTAEIAGLRFTSDFMRGKINAFKWVLVQLKEEKEELRT